ncbi:hypothetical protein TrST_g10285 [Triparma strigata]|uniref:Limiting CO2-inducible protein B/C beta carbonyic anhydrase domain-containing protein n=2 Tax=Triparma TaxID=722752 RepID=A0A9W7BC97_9STRA|nr:hypothetical protein TrST_g10285 [Triparma strigata]
MPSFTSTKTTVLPTIRRNTSTGAKLRGLAISTTNVKRRPKVGKIAKGIPMLPEVEPPRRVPRLKVKKGETRQVELRGQARKLHELTVGITRKFPNILPLQVFMEESSRILNNLGFDKDSALAVVGLSRDEVTRPFLNSITEAWGEPYVTHSLGAQCNVGREGIKQCLEHAPKKTSNARTKLVIFCCPNICCNQESETGLMYRNGKPEPCPTNSELQEFIKKLKVGTFNLHKNPHTFCPDDDIDPEMFDPSDLELSIMNQKLCKQLIRDGGFNDSSLQNITRVAGKSALYDFEKLISRYVNLELCDVAVIHAIQVHGQYQDFGKVDELKYETEFVALQEGYAVVKGERRDFRKDERHALLEVV